ncbi:MAG: TolC family protein [Planctomycetaceae bacterium]|nr:TolC family protein [Planctomycetaceae bacterium]MCB9949516.1 TolC family protein [Planctomycetaceae bacterium]
MAAVLILTLAACRHADTHDTFLFPGAGYGDYVDKATRINYPEVDLPLDERVNFAVEPRRLSRDEKDEVWDVSLAEAIQLALANSRVIRSSGQFLSPGNAILNNPDFARTVYDPAIQESGVLFGQRGVEAALSDFDAQFVTQMVWGRSELIQNNRANAGGLNSGDTLVNETGAYSSVIQKRLASGGQVAVSHSWNYTGTNAPLSMFPTAYDGNVRAEFRQPLLAGGGAEYTRIAGPVSTNIQGVTGVQQGVIIARINNDMALADFELAVQQLIHDVEATYWQLSLAYRSFDVQSEILDATISIREVMDAQHEAKTGEGGAQRKSVTEREIQLEFEVAQARDRLYAAEGELRRLLGLPINDGRIIRPLDDPMTARLAPNWETCLNDALTHRPELRRQKWSLKSLEMQLRAADNLTMPRLDLVAAYQVNGFGNNLLGGPSEAISNPGNLNSAYDTLFAGDQTGWNLGFEFSMPLGRRFAYAQQRSLELRIAKARELLNAQEVEVSHEVASVFRDIDRNYLASENALNRLLRNKDRLVLLQQQRNVDPTRTTIDSILQAKQTVAQSELQFLSSLVEYNNSLNDLAFRTGRTLENNSILLSEANWSPEAYQDADNHYRRRYYARRARWKIQTPDMSATIDLPTSYTAPVYELPDGVIAPPAPEDEIEPTPMESPDEPGVQVTSFTLPPLPE